MRVAPSQPANLGGCARGGVSPPEHGERSEALKIFEILSVTSGREATLPSITDHFLPPVF